MKVDSNSVGLTVRLSPPAGSGRIALAIRVRGALRKLLPNELESFQSARSELIPGRSFRLGHCLPQIPGSLSLFLIGWTHADNPPHPARVL
jgi:hypothetical protein